MKMGRSDIASTRPFGMFWGIYMFIMRIRVFSG